MKDVEVPVVRPMGRKAIAKIANEFLERHYPNLLELPSPFPVLKFCDEVLMDSYGIEFAIAELPPPIEGRFQGGVLAISNQTYEGLLRNDGRARFTAAHEIGHAVLHAQQMSQLSKESLEVSLFRRGSIPAFLDPEWQADEFAANVLMPASVVERLSTGVRVHARLVAAICRTMAVSRSAAKTRLHKLEKAGLMVPAAHISPA